MTLGAEMTADGCNTASICSLRVGADLFGIETWQIREVLGTTTPQSVPLAPEYIAGVVPYRGEVLTTVSLRALLGLERRSGANCILVFDGEQMEERFGLIVDGVSGVMALQRDMLQANPSGLDARSMELFDGVYRLPSGLLVHLDPRKLRPTRLAECGLFARVKQERQGDSR
jgi:purine-binding chemotaxis protein CheW